MEEDLDIRGDSLADNDKEFDKQLRPLEFNDFRGQKQIVEKSSGFYAQNHTSISTTSPETATPFSRPFILSKKVLCN